MRKIIKTVSKLAHELLCKLVGYVVLVEWHNGFMQAPSSYIHYAMTYQDAIDWMRQYPQDCDVSVMCNSNVIAHRFATID